MARDAEVTADLDAAACGGLHAEDVGQRVGPDAGGPDERVGLDHLTATQVHPCWRDLLDRRSRAHLDAPPHERLAGVALRGGAEGWQQLVAHLEQVHPGPVDVEVAEVLPEHLGEQLDERAGHLDAGGPAADDHEVQRAVVDERPVGVRSFEPAEHVVAQADGVAQAVEGQAVGVGALDAEGVGRRAGRQHQLVERQGVAALQRDLVPVPVDAGDGPLPEPQVLLLLEDAADGVGDVRCVQAGRGHLVQQRLERVEVVPVDERDLDGITGELLRRHHPAEPRANHDDVLLSVSRTHAFEARRCAERSRRCGVRQAEQLSR